MRMTTPDHTKWMVAICAKVFRRDQISRSELIELADPSTGDARSYVLVQNNNESETLIVETQCLEEEFSSFFVGRHVVKDGNLYVLNPVDPLFFFLAQKPQSKSTSWQPFEQTLEGCISNENTRKCISQEQLGHLCLTLCNDQTDNVVYFKFSQEKALVWLKKKQERVYQILLHQEKARSERRERIQRLCPKTSGSAATGGSISSTFCMPEDEMVAKPVQTQNTPSPGAISVNTLQRLKSESLQIVCNYLSDNWTAKLLESLQTSEDEIFLVPAAKKSTEKENSVTTSSSVSHSLTKNVDTTTPARVTPKIKMTEATRSIANKQLEKVNKRGMSSLTSFFKPKAKKQAVAKN